MNEEDVIYTQGNITQPSKRMNNVICSNMDGPRDYHTKQSKSERERQITYDIIYMYNLKQDTKKCIYKRETDSQMTDQTWGCQGG